MTSEPITSGLPDRFEITAPLPPPGSTLVLEASAGTGKTYTIASLAARYLAEGKARLDDMMLVTFGRMATQELRDRVRGRLLDVERALRDPAAALAAKEQDSVAALLAAGTGAEIHARQRNLAVALAAFDEATIATTHSFCSRMLDRLGIAADHDLDAEFRESTLDLQREIALDTYLQVFERPDQRFDLKAAQVVAGEVATATDVRLAPIGAPSGSMAAKRQLFAERMRAQFELRKRQLKVQDFDDLQVRLRQALTDPVSGAAARERLRRTYSVVLVDEFQDTDPDQWAILQAAFAGHSTLLLIGDPKQAIYAFRGADVNTYLDAVRHGHRSTLGTNYRTDGPLLAALDHLWATEVNGIRMPKALGDTGIKVHEVQAKHQDSRLHLPGVEPGSGALRLRRVGRHQLDTNRFGHVETAAARTAIVNDLAAEIVTLLTSGASITVDGQRRPLSARDIAVLVHENKQGVQVRDALRRSGVPAVFTGNASVFSDDSSAAARSWLTLLTALESPSRISQAHAAALSPFFGWTAAQLALASPEETDELIDRLLGYSRTWQRGGIAALLEALTEAGLAARVLAMAEGDRLLTDLRQIAHALNAAARTEHLGTAAQVQWLRHRMEETVSEGDRELSRRLSSQDDAVQILTVHRSKGLEFGVVLVPFAWDRFDRKEPHVLRLHDEAGARVLDVGGSGSPDYARHKARHDAEDVGEDLRLLYVAFTRARSLLITWWAPAMNSITGALGRMIFARTELDGTVAEQVDVPTDQQAAAAFDRLAARSGGRISWADIDPDRRLVLPIQPAPPVELQAREFPRVLTDRWRRTSYSGLTREIHELHYGLLEAMQTADRPADEPPSPETGSEPEDPGTVDEPDVTAGLSDGHLNESSSPEEYALQAIPSPLEDFPGGTAFGSVVHDLLEYVDTTVGDLGAELRAHARRALGEGEGLREGVDPDLLAAGLLPVMTTPLGPAAFGLSLAQIQPADRLAEMGFEIPMGGGDAARGELATSVVADLATVFAEHTPSGDLLADYPELLRDELLGGKDLCGYLSGSLDAVLRVRSGQQVRYLVVDYKTNRLGQSGQRLTAWDYRPAEMARGMMDAHYPLQALLYLVAVHRYLAWRQPGYQPQEHLGGALYLFVRGMTGPDNASLATGDGMPPMPCGVFTWQPTAALVQAASEVLAGKPSRALPAAEGRGGIGR